jgi:hypothetical protein
MSRLAVVCGMVGLGVMLAAGSPAPQAAAPAPPAPPRPVAQAAGDKLLSLLRMPQEKWEEIAVDPNYTLGAMLDGLAKKYSQPKGKPPLHLSFDFNDAAFKADGLDDPRLFQIVKEKPIPAMDSASLDRFLRKALARLPVPSGATYLIRQDHIEITTNQAIRAQIWGGHQGPFFPLIHADIENKPLDEALKELAKQSEHNIVVDARAAEKAKTIVTARFTNTPLDTAVALLADMADLKPVLQDNVIYLTTRENALRWESRQKKEMPAPDPEGPTGPRIGSGVRGFVPPMAGAGME